MLQQKTARRHTSTGSSSATASRCSCSGRSTPRSIRTWARRLRPAMRQVHRAGETTFIDFSGKRTGAGRSPYGRIPPGRAVCRRPRRQQPDLRRGDGDPAVARLGRRPHPHGRVLRRHDRLVGPRPAQERHHPPPAATSRASIAPTRTSPPTTAPSSYPHGRGNPRTKPPRRRQYSWPSGGYSPGSATRRSSTSARPGTRRS